jgi:hypothetical protein
MHTDVVVDPVRYEQDNASSEGRVNISRQKIAKYAASGSSRLSEPRQSKSWQNEPVSTTAHQARAEIEARPVASWSSRHESEVCKKVAHPAGASSVAWSTMITAPVVQGAARPRAAKSVRAPTSERGSVKLRPAAFTATSSAPTPTGLPDGRTVRRRRTRGDL